MQPETKTTPTTLFDKSLVQKMKFAKEDDEARYLLEFQCGALNDEILAEFDRLSFLKVEQEGENQVFVSDDLDACDWFFKENVKLTSGFEGELPNDWQDSFDLQERQMIVREFLNAYVKGSENTKFTRSFSFGKKQTSKITVIATFNGEEIELTHFLPDNKNNFLRRFIKITQGLINKKGKTGTFLPETYVKLGALYDEMNIKSEGYAALAAIPLHHKAIVLREAFGAQAESQRKKLNA